MLSAFYVCSIYSSSLQTSCLIWVHIVCNIGYLRNLADERSITDRRVKYSIRIHHECEGRIGKYVLRIIVCHQEACLMMTNGDPEGQIFLSHPNMTDGFSFWLTINYHGSNSSKKFLNTRRCDMI